MNHKILLILLSLSIFSAKHAYCEEDSPILVVDMNKVFQTSISGKAAIANVEQEKKKRGQIVLKMEDELKKLSQSINKQASVLSPAAMTEKKQQFEKKRQEYAKSAQEAQTELAKYQQEEFNKVLKVIDHILQTLASQHKGRFVLDFDKRVVLYAKENLDLTEELIETLDERSMKS
jgi:outer membrane protein